MTGHPNFPIIHEERSEISVDNTKLTIIVSTHRVREIDGDIIGIKFTNESGSLDSSIKTTGVDSYSIVNALASRTQQMIFPVLKRVAIIGFYLLTDDLGKRGNDAVLAKSRLYNMGARKIHSHFKHELPVITKMQLEGAFAWFMSKHELTSTTLFTELQREFARRIEVF